MTHCQECSRPWGLILERGELPTPEGLAAARVELIEMLREQWECDEEPDTLERVDWSSLPEVKAVAAVYFTDAFIDFCSDHNFAEMFGDGACWVELEWSDVPAWLLKGRKRRWAYRWDCCNIGNAESYAPTRSAS